MDMAFAAKIICDLSLWLCTSGFILSYFGYKAISFWPAVIMAGSCVLCYLLKNRKAPPRLLPLLALAFCVFWIHGPADVLLLIPPCLYCAWLCVKALFSPDYSACSGYFRISALILSAFLLLAVIAGGGARVQEFSLPYFFTFLFSGIAMLRLLRHDEQTRKEWRLWLVALLSLVLCCAGAIFLSSPLFLKSAGAALGALYRYVLHPLLLGIVYLMIGLVWLLEQIVNLFRHGQRPVETKPQDIINSMNLDLPDTADRGDGGPLRQILLALAVAAGIVLFIVLAFKLFRRLAGAAGRARDDSGGLVFRERLAGSGTPRPAAISLRPPRAPRDAVRWYYRKFLLKAKAGGITLLPADNSESIARAAGALFDPALIAELRKLYIAARYSPDAVTHDDAKKARELYGKLKANAVPTN